MTKRSNVVALLIACSLLGVLLLQLYFGYQVFQKHKSSLRREVNTALKTAVTSADRARVAQVNQLFARDLRNPSLVRLELRLEEEEPRIFVISPLTGDIHLSILFPGYLDSVEALQQMEEQILNRNRTFLEEGSVMHWTDELGRRLSRYNDSIHLSAEYLREEMSHQLALFDINSTFTLALEIDSVSADALPPSMVKSDVVTASIDDQAAVSVALTSPAYEILRRTGFVYLMSAVVSMLVGGSFLLLLRLINRQRRLAQLKDDFIDNVTHELLTPISTLKLALDALRQDPAVVKPNKYLDMSEQQAQRIADVVDHVLQVSFVNQQQAGIQLEELIPGEVLKEVLHYYDTTPNATITVHVEEETPLVSDPHHLRNVFHNLIGNALKYGPDHPTLKIRVKRDPTETRVSFTDNGPGIPADERESIFEKFHRVSEGDTHNVKGLGIGLYYSRNILRQLGGDLVLTRSDAAGSTFTVILPNSTH